MAVNSCSETILGIPVIIHFDGMRKVMQVVSRVAQTDAVKMASAASSPS